MPRYDTLKKAILVVAIIVFVGLVFSNSAFATGYFLQMPIRVQHSPTICAIEPQPNPKFPTIGKQLLDETEYAVIDWKTKLNQGLGKHPVWNINLVKVSNSEKNNFDYAKCNITINYYPEPQKDPSGFIATGVTIPNFETGKTDIEIYYSDVQPNWVKKEWFQDNQEYYTYVDMPYYTGLVATSTQLDSTIRHEIGHSFGLGHYIVPSDRLHNIINGLEDMPSIMIDTVTVLGVKHYDITSLDIAQIKSIYGDGGFDNQVGSKLQMSHQLNTDKKVYQPGEDIILDINTIGLGEKSFAEILVIDSNNTMIDNFGVTGSNSTILSGDKYQKNGKYTAELINPTTGDFDFTSFIVETPSAKPDNSSQKANTILQIPTWMKNNAKWWSQGTISDDEFTSGLQFLINQGTVKIPSSQPSVTHSGKIPDWVKTDAWLWSAGEMSDKEFVSGLQYLADNRVNQP